MGELGVMKSEVLSHGIEFDVEYALGLLRGNKVRMLEGWLARFVAEMLLNFDERHFAMTDSLIQRQIEINKRNGTLFELGRAYKLYSEFYWKTGDRKSTREQLNNAIETMIQCDASGWVEKFENDLFSLG